MPLGRCCRPTSSTPGNEMERVFTMGVGIVLVVSSDAAAGVQRQLDDLGFQRLATRGRANRRGRR